jgi:hypothetical protein
MCPMRHEGSDEASRPVPHMHGIARRCYHSQRMQYEMAKQSRWVATSLETILACGSSAAQTQHATHGSDRKLCMWHLHLQSPLRITIGVPTLLLQALSATVWSSLPNMGSGTPRRLSLDFRRTRIGSNHGAWTTAHLWDVCRCSYDCLRRTTRYRVASGWKYGRF